MELFPPLYIQKSNQFLLSLLCQWTLCEDFTIGIYVALFRQIYSLTCPQKFATRVICCVTCCSYLTILPIHQNWHVVRRVTSSVENALSSINRPTCPFSAGSLVWAKLEGHPWWPCMVVPQPLSGQQMRGSGRNQRVHVHFFDEPPTRGWVSTKYIREYQGLDFIDLIIVTVTLKIRWFCHAFFMLNQPPDRNNSTS